MASHASEPRDASITEVNMEFATKSYNTFKTNMAVNERGCFIPLKKPRPDGYVRFSITKGSAKAAFGEDAPLVERTFYVHHLAWYAEGRPMPKRVVEHLSHLCNDSRCFNVDHLVIESPVVNNSRKNCGFRVKCPCPCAVVFVSCSHVPPFVPRDREEE